MATIIKTSDEKWQTKATNLYYKRTSFSIIDDSKYGLNYVSDKLGLYKKTTLKGSQLLFVFVIYLLAVVCGVLIFLSFSLGDDKFFGIILSSIGLIVFAFVPTYYLIKNKAPKVDEIDNGYEVNF